MARGTLATPILGVNTQRTSPFALFLSFAMAASNARIGVCGIVTGSRR